MTNVKLKLMFFLLNALLTADIVQARPYADLNTTDIVIKFTNDSDTFNLPVDSNSDTLIVANDESETTDTLDNVENKSTEDFKESENKNEYEGEKQLNISSTLLKDIIDAETNRDETITDIFFRPESEFSEDIPRFEFLIAGKINESDFNRIVNSDNGVDRNGTDVLKKMDYVELVEVVKASKENRSAYTANITGHEVDNDLAPDTILSVFSGFTDLQTLFLACFATLLPLLAVLFATLLIRCLCRRYCPGFCNKPTGSSVSESSDKQSGNHQQLKSATDEGTASARVGGGDALAANGSIITMTLKNNHLIVETEERNDITRNGRETKMKYSPDNDGIFVVEVQQSTAYRPNKTLQISISHDPQISTNQALIHRVPEELEKKITEEDSERSTEQFERDKALALSSTGLSISDLSMSSIGSHNASYSYGSQVGYEQGPFGYPIYTGYDISKEGISEGITYNNSREPLISKTPTDPDKPVVTAAIFKQDSIICSDLQAPGYCIEGSTDGPLLSDVQARELSLQHLQEQRGKKIENGIPVTISDTPKKNLNRADSLPVRLEDDKDTDDGITKVPDMEVIIEDDLPNKDMLKGKRASLPIIRTEVYGSVKDVITTGSPKFEKVIESSPGDSRFDSPPMITITEESESSKSDGTS